MTIFPKLTKEQVADVVSYHSALTRQSFRPAERPPLSEKGAAAEALIATGTFGCNSESVARLVSILLTEPIAVRSTSAVILPGAVVCAGDAIFVVGIQNKGGSVRGHLADGQPMPNDFRPDKLSEPTAEQIAAFFEYRHGLRESMPEVASPNDDMTF